MNQFPTRRDVAAWFPERVRAAREALIKAGVPEQYHRYQEPVIVGREHDTAWLRFECAMWRRSYELELGRSVARLRTQ